MKESYFQEMFPICWFISFDRYLEIVRFSMKWFLNYTDIKIINAFTTKVGNIPSPKWKKMTAM